MTPAVRFDRVSRHFDTVRAVDEVSFEIAPGEFFSMLGPSGSGKTTCLRLIAGFEQPDGGRIELDGQAAEGLPPYERDVNTVFQDYALFPHMSVLDNVAYAMMVKGAPKAERHGRAREMLELVKLGDLGGRKPAQLSGGQRQRVALARALINSPRVLLLDEPLGALDLKLREEMQVELKALQRKLGITFIYVTHDQEEALSMSDRLAVFNQGRVEQIGRPQEIYEHPQSAFVAGFVGLSNILEPELAEALLGRPARASIRPEKISFLDPEANPAPDWIAVEGTIADVQYHGAVTRYRVRLTAGGELLVFRQNTEDTALPHGLPHSEEHERPVRLAWRARDVQTLAATSE